MNRAFIFFIVLLLVVEFYSYKGIIQWLSVYFPEGKKLIKIGYWLFSFFVFGMIVYTMVQYRSGQKNMTALLNFTMGLFVVVFLPKLVFMLTHLLDDVFYGLKWITGKLTNSPVSSDGRRQFITTLGLGTSAFLSLTLLTGLKWFRLVMHI